MELFHEYYSSQCQFAFDLLARAKTKPEFTGRELSSILSENHAPDLYTEIRKQFLESGFLVEKSNGSYALGDGFAPFRAPLSDLERAYLSYLCGTPEAALFLAQETLDKIKTACGQADGDMFAQIRRPPAPCAPPADPQVFRALLEAIAHRQMVRYRFRPAGQAQWSQASRVAPFRLEHSVLDGRWWAILYLLDENRPVKARLERISDVELAGPHNVPEETMRQAILRQVEDEPIVLRITPEKNALERAFLTFENGLDMNARLLEDGSVRLTFSLFRFDRKDVVKKLLYLGEAVTLEGPRSLCNEMREKLEACLRPTDETYSDLQNC